MQIRIIDYINEVTDITTAKEIAERNAYRDGLTGTGNKASYEQKMKELDEAIGSGIAEFAIVMVDVNDLKSTNDRYGHSAGDMMNSVQEAVSFLCGNRRKVFQTIGCAMLAAGCAVLFAGTLLPAGTARAAAWAGFLLLGAGYGFTFIKTA